MDILHTEPERPQSPGNRRTAGVLSVKISGSDTIIVTDTPLRITARHQNGIGPRERDLWAEAIDYMAGVGPLAFVSVTGSAEPAVRGLSRRLKSYIALRQDRAGMRRTLWGEVRETKARDNTPKPGAHIVAPMRSAAERDQLVAGINASAVYGDTLAKAIDDVEAVKAYGLKEMTTQAAHKTGIRRVKGSHPLPEGGDRVRAAPALRDALIRIGRIAPYTRTNAKRARIEPQAWQFDAEGQGVLFDRLPALVAPQRKREPVRRDKITPAPMLRLFTVVGNIDVLEAMRGLGQTHEAIGARLGLSRAQTTNILNAQFRPSREIVRRVIALAQAA